jgi:hypothetical protein
VLTQALVLAGAALLFGCPQLLDGDFEALSPTPDGGEPPCAGGLCSIQGGNGGSGADAPLVAGSGPGGAGADGAGGRGGAGGAAGTSGSAGSAGVGGASGAGGSGGGSGASGASGAGGASSSPECWTIALNDSTHSDTSNCLGIEGWNAITVDTQAPPTVVDVSYENGKVCFDGTITSNKWGAVYNFTFAPGDGENSWNAETHGVGGFELGVSGPVLPPKIEFKYTDSGSDDCCRVIQPVSTVEIPFESTHPGCDTTTSTATPDTARLTHIRLAMPPAQAAYEIDFCVQLRAIP